MIREYVMGGYIISFCINTEKTTMNICKRVGNEMHIIYSTEDAQVIRKFLNLCNERG